MQLGVLVGRAGFGGVALALERRLGAATVVYLLVASVWSSMLLVLLAVRGGAEKEMAPDARARVRAFFSTLGAVLRMPRTWLGFSIAALAGAAMEATGAVAGPLLVDRGFSKEAVGSFFALPAVACMATGALLGGRISDRGRRSVMLGLALVALAVAVSGVGVAAREGTPGSVLLGALSLAYLLFGVFTASGYALYMDLTSPELGATQFSAYMGAVNLCGVWSAWAVGRLAGGFGYPVALPLMALASLAALPLLAGLARVRARGGLGAGLPTAR